VKCLAVLTTILALGCHQPLEKQYEPVERDNCEGPDIDFHLPFVVCGSSTAIDGTNFVKIFAYGTNVEEMLIFLRSREISPEIDDSGHAKLYDSMKLRAAVAEYLGILDRRIAVIANNLANVHTLAYRSKVLLVHEDGNTSVEPNMLPFPLEYAPEDPSAIKEGPNKGYVRRTNVDVVREEIDLMLTRRVYRLGRDLLRSLYNGPLCKRCSERTSALPES
jgi:flagellar basal body rod protein FlgC